MKIFSSPSQKRGELGEQIVCMYLKKHGFRIIERNFTRRWGEIDIIAERDGILHFIEVKSVTREIQEYRPEDQVHAGKQKKLARTIETYLAIHEIGGWQFDVACVLLNMEKRTARVRLVSDIILAARN